VNNKVKMILIENTNTLRNLTSYSELMVPKSTSGLVILASLT